VRLLASSRASPLPQGFADNQISLADTDSCGSWLACDEARTGTAYLVMKPTCLRHDVLSYAI